MKNFLLAQPLLLFFTTVGLLCSLASPLIGVPVLIVGIAGAVIVSYLLRNRRLAKIKANIKTHNFTVLEVIPVTSGILGIDGLVLTPKKMHLLTDRTEEWVIKYDEVSKVDVDVYKMKYIFTLKNGSKKKVSIHPLKDKKDILSTFKNPQVGVGAMSMAALPAYASVSALSISAGSARSRVETMSKKLAALLPKEIVITPSFEGAFSSKDIILGIILGVELVAMVILGVILFMPPELYS